MTQATKDLIAIALSQGISALLEAYRLHTGKPQGWYPSDTDWAELEAFAARTPEQIKKEAADRLGVEWPKPDEPQAPV